MTFSPHNLFFVGSSGINIIKYSHHNHVPLLFRENNQLLHLLGEIITDGNLNSQASGDMRWIQFLPPGQSNFHFRRSDWHLSRELTL